jgi:hypothetical protein
MTPLTPCGGDVMVSPADFLDLGPVPLNLNELAVVMDVRPVREEMVCCALVQHKPKEGSHWWEVCGGTGSHSQQGLHFCGRHQNSLPDLGPVLLPPGFCCLCRLAVLGPHRTGAPCGARGMLFRLNESTGASTREAWIYCLLVKARTAATLGCVVVARLQQL